MEFNIKDLDAMKEILAKDKKRYKRYEAMKLAGYGVAMAGVALGGAWLYGTTDAVDQSVFQATKDTLLASGIFAGGGIVAGLLASTKARKVKKCMQQIESTITGYKIKRKWSFKPYIERKVKSVTPMSQNQRAIANLGLIRNIKKYLDKGILSTAQVESLCNVYPELKDLADSYMPMGNPEPIKPEPVVEEPSTEMVDSLTAFENAMTDVIVDDTDEEKIGATAELVLTTIVDGKDKVLSTTKYVTPRGAQQGQMALLENAQLLNKHWYPLQFDVILKDDEGNVVMSDGAKFNDATQLEAYYNAVKENIENEAKLAEEAKVEEESILI